MNLSRTNLRRRLVRDRRGRTLMPTLRFVSHAKKRFVICSEAGGLTAQEFLTLESAEVIGVLLHATPCLNTIFALRVGK